MMIVTKQHSIFFRTERFIFLNFVYTMMLFGEVEIGSAQEQPYQGIFEPMVKSV